MYQSSALPGKTLFRCAVYKAFLLEETVLLKSDSRLETFSTDFGERRVFTIVEMAL